MSNSVTYTNKYIDRLGGSLNEYKVTVTKTNIHEEKLKLEHVQQEYNSKDNFNYIKLSNLIAQLQSLYEKFGDGYVRCLGDEMTDEIFSILVDDEHIEFEGLPEDIESVVDNRFFSLF